MALLKFSLSAAVSSPVDDEPGLTASTILWVPETVHYGSGIAWVGDHIIVHGTGGLTMLGWVTANNELVGRRQP